MVQLGSESLAVRCCVNSCRRIAGPTDKPAKNQKIDMAQCLEYAASRDLSYVKPVAPPVEDEMTKLFGPMLKMLGLDKKNSSKFVNMGAGRST